MADEQIVLKFSKTEYERLLKMVYLADWVINSHRVGDTKTDYSRLEGKVFSYAGTAGLGKYAEIDRERGVCRPSIEIDEDEEIQNFIDEYDEDVFWEDLCWDLAERDLARRYPDCPPEERFTRLCRLYDAYGAEFEASGLENLFLVKSRFLKKLAAAGAALAGAAKRALNRARRAKTPPQGEKGPE
ncbi:MAG: hypothetical protein COT17_00090 [Elusimicrobia bacterium CG08_land_8_20_14_0_20_51_18]|nr:MAG: hypothetical protein COT17_00090 [Elusimicrobia bacterium CG08_land_8_20_14_0_20_51_18]